MTHGLLDGVTVLDLASVGPAARASRWLADYGADVVKVGPVPADGGVQITPPFYAYSGHRGMRRVLLDLKSDSGKQTFLTLAETADVVIESFRPGVVDRLGIGYHQVNERNPRIVYCSTTGFGQEGPRSQWAGHDVNYLAVSGYLDASGRGPGGKPPLPGATVADSAGGGLQAVTAILAALVSRASTGEGAYLDVSIADGMLGIMALAVDEHLATGETPQPGSGLLTGAYACYDTYRAKDGRWLAVGAIENRFWANLCRLLGLERWSDKQMDASVQDEIREDLTTALGARTRDEWVAILSSADTCVAPILTVAETTGDEQYLARRMFSAAAMDDEDRTQITQVAPAFAGMRKSDHGYVVRAADATDTDEVLIKAGFTGEEISALRAEGAIA